MGLCWWGMGSDVLVCWGVVAWCGCVGVVEGCCCFLVVECTFWKVAVSFVAGSTPFRLSFRSRHPAKLRRDVSASTCSLP